MPTVTFDGAREGVPIENSWFAPASLASCTAQRQVTPSQLEAAQQILVGALNTAYPTVCSPGPNTTQEIAALLLLNSLLAGTRACNQNEQLFKSVQHMTQCDSTTSQLLLNQLLASLQRPNAPFGTPLMSSPREGEQNQLLSNILGLLPSFDMPSSPVRRTSPCEQRQPDAYQYPFLSPLFGLEQNHLSAMQLSQQQLPSARHNCSLNASADLVLSLLGAIADNRGEIQ